MPQTHDLGVELKRGVLKGSQGFFRDPDPVLGK